MSKKEMQLFLEQIAIVKRDLEKLAQVRRELAFYVGREETQPDRLSVQLY